MYHSANIKLVGDKVALEPILSAGEYVACRDAFASALATIFKGNKQSVALKKIADLASCGFKEICVFSVQTITRNNSKINVMYLHYHFNEIFNAALKETEVARFDQNRKSWNLPLPLSETSINVLRHHLPLHFNLLIDLSVGRAFTLSKPLEIEKPEFKELHEEGVRFTNETVYEAILAGRENDKPIIGQIFMFNGNVFEKLTHEDYSTRHELVLVRYAVEGGSPRYMLLHTFAPDNDSEGGYGYFGMAEFAFYNERSLIGSLTDEITQRKIDSNQPLFSRVVDLKLNFN
jgi:hypothetical protein